jgi:hypothetical protein
MSLNLLFTLRSVRFLITPSVYQSAELVSALKRWRLRCPKGEHDLVCPNAQGRPMQSSDLLRTGLHPALRRATLPRRAAVGSLVAPPAVQERRVLATRGM